MCFYLQKRGGAMDSYRELIRLFTRINDPEEMETFFSEIFTPRELSDMAMRWQLLKELYEGNPQRVIANRHHISLCKITRGSKLLKKDHSVTKILLDRYYGKK